MCFTKVELLCLCQSSSDSSELLRFWTSFNIIIRCVVSAGCLARLWIEDDWASCRELSRWSWNYRQGRFLGDLLPNSLFNIAYFWESGLTSIFLDLSWNFAGFVLILFVKCFADSGQGWVSLHFVWSILNNGGLCCGVQHLLCLHFSKLLNFRLVKQLWMKKVINL